MVLPGIERCADQQQICIPRGDSRIKGLGMLLVSLRGVNFGFWSHLGCSGQLPLYLAVKVSFTVAREKLLYFLYLSVF